MRVAALIDPHHPEAAAFALEAERIGVASLWVPEVWGYDALTGLAHLAAQTTTIGLGTFVVQLGSRSPALLATSALSLQSLSHGRFHLGIGVSGPQVMEGWHGVRFRRPVQATRETIEIIRTVSRGDVLRHDGEIYPLPLPDSQGRALRPMLPPGEVPIYVAAMGPANLRLTGELADGWLANAFIPESAEAFLGPLREGAARGGRSLADLDLVAPVALEITPTTPPGTKPPVATLAATRSPSAPWGAAAPTSTTTPSPDSASPMRSPRWNACGVPAGARRRPTPCRSSWERARTWWAPRPPSPPACRGIGTRASPPCWPSSADPTSTSSPSSRPWCGLAAETG